MDRKFFGIFVILSLCVFSFGSVLALPYGSSITEVSSESATASAPQSDGAIAGNVTEITISGDSTTQTWQGYFGNVTGTIQLADASDNVMYNWSQASAIGEVYASVNDSIGWVSISCFNLSSDLTTLESAYGVGVSDVDGVDETFALNNHVEFYTGAVQFTSGECNNTKVFGEGGTTTFDEVLLTDSSDRVVFASLLDDDTLGFDGATHDFEMLVLENGHGNTDLTTYYFYVEL